MKANHYSVLLQETIKSLKIKPHGIYVDMTLGLGGHTEKIVENLTTGKVIAIDQDQNAIELSKERLKLYKDKIIFVKQNFRNIDIILQQLNIDKVDGIIYDLGTSYYQLTSEERGFSYKADLLDMRMNISQEKNAIDILNNYSKKELEELFFNYGDVKFARDLSNEIIKFREVEKIEKTQQLNSIIDKFSKKNRRSNLNNIYQAIRIEVNDEINALKESLEKSFNILKLNGIISVITFHSLEDKIVKEIFNQKRDIQHETVHEIIRFYRTTKVIHPSSFELGQNNASRSAKLRSIIKNHE